MFDVVDCSSWREWDGSSEGSGRSEKVWLVSDHDQICLFKYPKSTETTEHVSEHLACQIGKIIGIKTAEIDLGYRNERMGSISYRLNTDTEDLLEGVLFISRQYPRFNADKLLDEESGLYYCLQMIEESLAELFIPEAMAKMLLFDFLIGNTDRHQSNWAIILETVKPCQTLLGRARFMTMVHRYVAMQMKRKSIKSIITTKMPCVRLPIPNQGQGFG